ncbi:hypothetical protein Micbo1qcDRAFT_208065 [Microdochium bolleyi]|uniref:Uncharacterized protein n=1 Tax=Microdochium bolleyi TaxID=196109 RepID=A0A136IRC8_9PEZI|nr:hypothetical protein Micbo1qcDRAFT_208065 [Microdochium bolleyi]
MPWSHIIRPTPPNSSSASTKSEGVHINGTRAKELLSKFRVIGFRRVGNTVQPIIMDDPAEAQPDRREIVIDVQPVDSHDSPQASNSSRTHRRGSSSRRIPSITVMSADGSMTVNHSTRSGTIATKFDNFKHSLKRLSTGSVVSWYRKRFQKSEPNCPGRARTAFARLRGRNGHVRDRDGITQERARLATSSNSSPDSELPILGRLVLDEPNLGDEFSSQSVRFYSDGEVDFVSVS